MTRPAPGGEGQQVKTDLCVLQAGSTRGQSGGGAVQALVGAGGQLHNTENGQFVSPDDPNVRVKRMRAAAAAALRGQ